MKGTPFSEYREEQTRVNVFDYFVAPSFFDQFLDPKPLLIYGSRGSGKTTLFKALSISEAKNVKDYLKNNSYIGIYYRIDLNIMASFEGNDISDAQWTKLFSYYFSSALAYELLRQLINIKDEINLQNSTDFLEKYSRSFGKKGTVNSLENLRKLVGDELFNIRDYINNLASESFPHIGDYDVIVNDLPVDICNLGDNLQDKIVFFLIDEFEGLKAWQQKVVLSFVKYSNDKHTYKICMRPDGLKSAETIGGEFISETDDVKSIDLDKIILDDKKKLYRYALDVCQKRMDLFYTKNGIKLTDSENIRFDQLFEKLSTADEQRILVEKRADRVKKDIVEFFEEYPCEDDLIKKRCESDYYIFLLFRLYFLKNKGKAIDSVDKAWAKYIENKETFEHNYKRAIIYQSYYLLSKNLICAGFETLVDISGGTMRYLLEICNEIFEMAVSRGEFRYQNPTPISYSIQSKAVDIISNKRVKQISAVPQIGPNIRTFVMAFGEICQAYHKERTISKIEPNHFSLKSSEYGLDENISLFLKECVMRGILIKRKNNKRKSPKVGTDEYLYSLHPIYTPAFKISWRRKQKIEFTVAELSTLASNNTDRINKLISSYHEKTKTQTQEDFFVQESLHDGEE